MSFRVELSPLARAQIAAINLWWAENRPAAPSLVAAEFETTIQRLSSSPESGRLHDRPGQVHIRKVLMPRSSRYHLYYEVDPASRLVTILAVWHVARGQGPEM